MTTTEGWSWNWSAFYLAKAMKDSDVFVFPFRSVLWFDGPPLTRLRLIGVVSLVESLKVSKHPRSKLEECMGFMPNSLRLRKSLLLVGGCVSELKMI